MKPVEQSEFSIICKTLPISFSSSLHHAPIGQLRHVNTTAPLKQGLSAPPAPTSRTGGVSPVYLNPFARDV